MVDIVLQPASFVELAMNVTDWLRKQFELWLLLACL
jgi:hypothetical protein